MNTQIRKNDSFYDLIQDIIETEEYCKMQEYRHHINGNTYEHSIKVAYVAHYRYMCKQKR